MFVASILPGIEAERPVSEENSRRYPAKGKLASSTPKVKRRLINDLLTKLTGIRRKAILHSTNTIYNRQYEATDCSPKRLRRSAKNTLISRSAIKKYMKKKIGTLNPIGITERFSFY